MSALTILPLQKSLEADFGYEDDFVVETALRESLAELRSARLHSAGPPPDHELPQKPFGLVDLPSEEQERMVGHRTPMAEQEKELHRNSLRREEVNAMKLSSDLSINNDSMDSINTPISVRRQLDTDTDSQVKEYGDTSANADTNNVTLDTAVPAQHQVKVLLTAI